jgi:tetratricopeptide (TPR) repeat protein
LSFDPWNGLALYLIGLGKLHLGRFDDALATFLQADRFDTPQVSRWTWLLGAGWANVLNGHYEEALPWLQRSIAITPASGRPQMLLAAAYLKVGRIDEAKAAMQEGLKLRPGSTALNIALPRKNASPALWKRPTGSSSSWSAPGCRSAERVFFGTTVARSYAPRPYTGHSK